LLVVGFLGGYTTFSSFSFETLGLIRDGSYVSAFGYVLGSVLFGLIGTWLGDVGARALTGGKG
jgi:CrcB protein